ncbi:hypothetical protein [Methylobacterium radiodurans]|uniref:Glycosyltransferase RgtA/B/C/D-like domain-containing protein n=1 Tax=Methylobacterium radiodurans TaxID=2202828 RepID=A0A2U8VLJ6_9HYPH|nr:hypothetical protein [Methylobacterium radiodurans]AWN34525.1 hypothetical protein DK427_01185 [Methylobacterium radiodurans]
MAPHDRAVSEPVAGRGLLLLLVVLLALGGVANALRKDIAKGFDEVAHVSYVAQIQREGALWPDLRALRMLDPASLVPTALPNYLNHPPPYYAALARIGPAIGSDPGALLALRLINVGLATAAMAALLLLAAGLARSRFEFWAYAIPLVTIPTTLALNGAVNNDNLAILGGALALLGLQRLLCGASRAWLAAVLAGLVAAGLAKFTALLLVGGCAGPVLLRLVARGRLPAAALVPAAVALALSAAPYAVLLVQYGSPVPEVPGHLAMMQEGAQAAGWDGARLGFPAYLLNFAALFAVQFMPVLTEPGPVGTVALVLPLALMGLSLAGGGAALARLGAGRPHPLDPLAVAGWAAIGLVLAAHVRFGYLNHLDTGWRLDAYPRYYLPLAGITVVACACLLAGLPEGWARRAILTVLAGGPIAFSLLGAPLGG